MVLSADERRPIEDALAESIGREHARRLMDELPAAEVATKDFVHGEIGRLEGKIHGLDGRVNSLRGEIRGEIGELRAEMHHGFRRMTAWFAGALIGLTTTMVAGFVTLATL